MKPTPDFTEVWRTIERSHSSLVAQQLEDAIPVFLSAIAFTLFIIALAAVLIYRNRKAIKRFFD